MIELETTRWEIVDRLGVDDWDDVVEIFGDAENLAQIRAILADRFPEQHTGNLARLILDELSQD